MALRDDPALRGRTEVFHDREDAGEHLARMLTALSPTDPVIAAIPAGGVPVAVPIARALGAPIDVAVVSKITLPWNSEAGYGAVAFDGTVALNEALVAELPLTKKQIREGVAATRRKVERRMARLRGGSGVPELRGRTAILVDDGIASGFTLGVAISACRALGPRSLWVAVPTGHDTAVHALASLVDELLCANVRGGARFAVADAYRRWTDVPEVVADELLRPFRAVDRPWADEWPKPRA